MIIKRTITAINRMYYVLETVQADFPRTLSLLRMVLYRTLCKSCSLY